MIFDYFLQDDKTRSIRRYRPGEQAGERWDASKQVWTTDCARRRACELTGDRRLTEADALRMAK